MWAFSQSCKSKARLDGRTVVITGANSGIGKETARDLYRRGARVILSCRDLAKAKATAKDIKATHLPSPGEVIVCKLDLNSLIIVKECAKQISTTESDVHILINNAGIMMCPKGVTEDGFETQLGVNHLAHFLFTLLLLPKIIQSRKDSDPYCRIINVSSKAHSFPGADINFVDLMSEKSYSPIGAYQQSKLANILFTRELAHRLADANIAGVNTYSLHPGIIQTQLTRHFDQTVFRGAKLLHNMLSPFMMTTEQGIQTTLHCALAEEAAKETGLYYSGCAVDTPSNAALDNAKASRLWDVSLKLVGFTSNYNLAEIFDQISREYVK